MQRSLPCPVCRTHGCASRSGGACTPTVERRQSEKDRRADERRLFPRAEGRRKTGGRRIGDPIG